jgi:hypothetical protein
MPLRDHFRPPVSSHSSWEGFHGMWPATMVMQLTQVLPQEFTAEPRAHLGTYFEIDVCAFEGSRPEPGLKTPSASGNGATTALKTGNGAGIATATLAAPQPTWTTDAEITEQYAYEVLVYDQSRGRQLLAAVEIVSPANKDRPENRRAFVAKCATLLQQRVCVSIVDLVTVRHFNLYADLLDLMGRSDPTFSPKPPATYAITCRGRRVQEQPLFETWAYPLIVGQPLPKLPIWLTEEIWVSLDLEVSYEETCRVLRIR